jgi:uncharacterized LabA/DUF88 family protein
MEKSVVLIDSENVIRSWRMHSGKKIDYMKLINAVSIGTNLLRAYLYDGVPEVIPPRKQKFLHALQRAGIQLRTKILKNRTYSCDYCNMPTTRQVQKGVDVSLATDILRHAFQQSCDICIIISGDEDYKDAIDVAKDKGIKVWICSFKRALSYELERSADKVVLIDNIMDEISA